MGKLKCLSGLLITVVMVLFCVRDSYANLVFPAVAHQFMVSLVIPSYWSIVMALLILIVETFFIKKLFTVNYIISFIFSFIINAISSIAGAFIVTFFEFPARKISGGIFAYANMRLGTYVGMVPGYILTVLLEGVLLFLIALIMKKKLKMSPCMKTSAIMNCFSYLIIIIGVIIADIMTKGANFKTY